METDYILQYHDYKGNLQMTMLAGNTVEEALEGPAVPEEALTTNFTIHEVNASHTKKDLVSSGNYDDVIPE